MHFFNKLLCFACLGLGLSNGSLRQENRSVAPPIVREIAPNNNHIPDTVVCGQGADDQTQPITNDFPWIASIEYTKPIGKGFHCMGVLISSRYVLTVAHCVSSDSIPKNWRLTGVRLGEWNSNSNNAFILDVDVESTTVHDRYNPRERQQLNDIALIKLATTVQFSAKVSPICLPIFNQQQMDATSNVQEFYLGGGVKNRNKPEEKFQGSARVQPVSHFSCTGVYHRAGFELSSSQICAGRNTAEGSCKGNAGAPLMMYQRINGRNNWYVVGLDSFGPADCSKEDWPEIYTKVASYGRWISRNVAA